jgi:hypothetical protein
LQEVKLDVRNGKKLQELNRILNMMSEQEKRELLALEPHRAGPSVPKGSQGKPAGHQTPASSPILTKPKASLDNPSSSTSSPMENSEGHKPYGEDHHLEIRDNESDDDDDDRDDDDLHD